MPFRPEERLLDLARIVKRKDGHGDTLHAYRDRYQADLVAFISALPGATVNASVISTTAVYISNFRGDKAATPFRPAGTLPTIDFSKGH